MVRKAVLSLLNQMEASHVVVMSVKLIVRYYIDQNNIEKIMGIYAMQGCTNDGTITYSPQFLHL